jgi:uncharacterized protein (TIGR03086 family)
LVVLIDRFLLTGVSRFAKIQLPWSPQMSSPELIDQAVKATAQIMAGLRPEHMSNPTACEDFDVRGLALHMAGVFNSSAGAAREPEETDSTTPEELLGDDPASALGALTSRMAAAWDTPDSFEGRTLFGTREMSSFMAGTISFSETLFHAWDLASATGQTLNLPDDLAEAALAAAQRLCSDRAREAGAFGPEVVVSEGAGPFDCALALTGRDPSWSA